MIMVKLLGLTLDGHVGFEWLDECKTGVAKAGAAVSTIKSLNREQPYSHAVVVAYMLPYGKYSASIRQTL